MWLRHKEQVLYLVSYHVDLPDSFVSQNWYILLCHYRAITPLYETEIDTDPWGILKEIRDITPHFHLFVHHVSATYE